MIKFFLDTGVFISYFGRKSDSTRTINAKLLIDHIDDISGEILYSQRTYHELKKHEWKKRKTFLKQCTLSSYHYGNESFNEIDGTFDNIGSIWNNDKGDEYKLSNELFKYMSKYRELHDRGILLDAIMNNCNYFIHENPNDFNLIPKEITNQFNLIVIDLIKVGKDVTKIIKL